MDVYHLGQNTVCKVCAYFWGSLYQMSTFSVSRERKCVRSLSLLWGLSILIFTFYTLWKNLFWFLLFFSSPHFFSTFFTFLINRILVVVTMMFVTLWISLIFYFVTNESSVEVVAQNVNLKEKKSVLFFVQNHLEVLWYQTYI